MKARSAVLILLALILGSCRGQGTSGRFDWDNLAQDRRRNTEAARKHYARALEHLEGDDLDSAEKELQAALEADLFFGLAHNNLGVVYYRQKRYYKAAWEFQYAAKLMPNRAQPKNNMGMVFEAVGKLDQAAEWYEKALALEPDSVQVIGNLARVYVRTNRKDEKTRKLLEDIVLKDGRPEWVKWARERLATMGQPQEDMRTPLAPGPGPPRAE